MLKYFLLSKQEGTLLNIFVETDLFFRILWQIESSKNIILFEIKIYFNIKNVFTLTLI